MSPSHKFSCYCVWCMVQSLWSAPMVICNFEKQRSLLHSTTSEPAHCIVMAAGGLLFYQYRSSSSAGKLAQATSHLESQTHYPISCITHLLLSSFVSSAWFSTLYSRRTAYHYGNSQYRFLDHKVTLHCRLLHATARLWCQLFPSIA